MGPWPHLIIQTEGQVMSQKTPLQKHIDGLCEELGITEKPYHSNTTIAELQKIIDELEAKLPEEDNDASDDLDSETEQSDPQDSSNEDDEPDLGTTDKDNSSLDESEPTSNQSEALPSGSEITSVDIKDIPENATIEDKGVEVNSDENGDLEIKAKYTIIVKSHGKRLKIIKGKKAFVEEAAALSAVDEGVAVLLSK